MKMMQDEMADEGALVSPSWPIKDALGRPWRARLLMSSEHGVDIEIEPGADFGDLQALTPLMEGAPMPLLAIPHIVNLRGPGEHMSNFCARIDPAAFETFESLKREFGVSFA